jgi:23S rRNA pseudouridine2605 synthase
MQLRLQVILSRAGVASRRAAEGLIQEGKVSVNGKVVTELGSRADPERDVITVSGRKIELNRQNRYILVNKPEGTITSKSDPEGRPTVMNLLPNELQELHPVGRLDWATEGVLLFTDDGALTYALTHPRFEVRREYHVKLKGKLGENDAVRWLEGATLEDGLARADTADIIGSTGKHSWLQITLHEGKNREIRRLAEALGYEVQRLRRYSFAGLTIEGVPPGGYRFLDLDEIEKLRQIAKASGADNIEEKVVGGPPEGVSRAGQMVETKGHRGAMVYDLTPKGIEPTTQRGTTRLDDFDEDGNLLRKISAPKPEEHVGRYGTRTWVSQDAQMQRPERSPEGHRALPCGAPTRRLQPTQ